MKKWYEKQSENGKSLFWMSIVGVVGTVLLLPLFLFSKPGYSIGFLLGSLIEVFCFFLICKMGDAMSSITSGNPKPATMGLAVFGYFIRFLLYAGGLVLGALCTFYWRNDLCSIWTVFAGYVPMMIIVFVRYSFGKKNVTPNRDTNQE